MYLRFNGGPEKERESARKPHEALNGNPQKQSPLDIATVVNKAKVGVEAPGSGKVRTI